VKYATEDAGQRMKEHFIIEELDKMEQVNPKADTRILILYE
jgi:hypothetical protein